MIIQVCIRALEAQAGAYLGLYCMQRLGVFPHLPILSGWDARQSLNYPTQH